MANSIKPNTRSSAKQGAAPNKRDSSLKSERTWDEGIQPLDEES